MAALQERNGSYRVLFRVHGKQHALTLGKVSSEEAEAKTAKVDYLLLRIRQRLLTVPPGMDISTFILLDGKPPVAESVPNSARKATLGVLRDRYIATHSNGTIEANSLETAKLHFSHFCRTLGEAFPLSELSPAKLQEH